MSGPANTYTQNQTSDSTRLHFAFEAKAPVYRVREDLYESLKDVSEARGGFDPETNTLVDIFRSTMDETQFCQFKRKIVPYFRALDWDPYDARLREIEFIKSQESLNNAQLELLNQYFLGDVERKRVYQRLSMPLDCFLADELKPTRKKAFVDLEIRDTASGGMWSATVMESETVSQRVDRDDYRSQRRRYKLIVSDVIEMPEFQDLIANVVFMVQDRAPAVAKMKVTAWMMSCHAYTGTPATNSPEGIHQDGADFIVSAFVVERRNVLGGRSRIFEGGATEPIMTRTLTEGEGLFQSDAGSPLFHDVTEVKVASADELEGVRSILGFDVYVERA